MNLSPRLHRLACMPLLAWACAAAPQVVADGPPCHQAEVREALERIQARLPEVRQLLQDVEAAKYQCRVVRKSSGSAVTDTRGDHAIIGWPGSAGRHADGSCKDADASPVHELHHCWVRAKHGGEEPCAYVPTRTASGALVNARASCEFDAVRLENRYRKAVGLCERLAYDVLLVPGAERTCAEQEAVCRPSTQCTAAHPPAQMRSGSAYPVISR
jgi:hypothetical protein